MTDIVTVLFTASLSFAALFLIAKLMGKNQISELNFVDYAVGISIGSIAAQMSIDNEIPFYHYLAAMFIYFLFDMVISYISLKSLKMKKLLRGTPQILINDGKLEYENFKKNRLDINEFLAMCREKNYFDINDIAYCIYETNGEISILPKSHATPLVSGDMNISKARPSLTADMVIDGQIIDKALEKEGKTADWLLNKLKSKNADLDNIALANYNKQNDDVIIFFKN